MLTHESMIRSCIGAIGAGDDATLLLLLADKAAFHFPGHNRFAGDYTGNKAIAEFWAAHGAELAGEIRIEDVRASGEQVLALVTMQAARDGAILGWHGTFLFYVHAAQIAEWWCQLGDGRAFDAFWTYRPTA